MSVLKYKDPETGEIKKVGTPNIDAYSKVEVDAKLANHANNLSNHTNNKNNPHNVTIQQIGAAPAYTYGTADIVAGSASDKPNGSLHFVIE